MHDLCATAMDPNGLGSAWHKRHDRDQRGARACRFVGSHLKALVAAWLAGGLGFGCGRVVTQIDGNAQSNGAGGGAVTTSAGAGGAASSGSGSKQPAPACSHATDHAELMYYGLQTFFCGGLGDADQFAARVVSSWPNGVNFSPCIDGAGTGGSCPFDPNVGSLSVTTSKDLAIDIPAGAFTNVEYTIDTYSPCTQGFLVRNAPEWQGTQNPITAAPLLWFAIYDGALSLYRDEPFLMEIGPACDSGTPAVVDHFLELSWPGSSARAVELAPGATWTGITPSGETWLVRNLRSFTPSDAPDSKHDMAFWIVRVPSPTEAP